MKKLCLVAVSTLTIVVVTAAPAAAAQQAPGRPAGVFCKIFPLLCR
jgi:hypothetical protein